MVEAEKTGFSRLLLYSSRMNKKYFCTSWRGPFESCKSWRADDADSLSYHKKKAARRAKNLNNKKCFMSFDSSSYSCFPQCSLYENIFFALNSSPFVVFELVSLKGNSFQNLALFVLSLPSRLETFFTRGSSFSLTENMRW